MNPNEIKFENIPSSKEEAFIYLEDQVRKALEEDSAQDRVVNADQNGNYLGDFEPERTYVSNVLAFLDELRLEIGVENIVDFSRSNRDRFHGAFLQFRQQVVYAIARFRLRNARREDRSIGTDIEIHSDYKSKITGLLNTIRKIVNQEIDDDSKKDRIFSKINFLQLEIDREKTTIDSLFGLALDLTRTISECADNLEPLLEKVERLKKLIWNNSKRIESLPGKERQKLIEEQPDDFEDDIPF